jgi:hypothetical protein
MLLAGRVDYTAAAGDYIAFKYDGTNWYETQRRLAASTGTTNITADNGLTANTTTNVQMGGTLLQNTTIATTANYSLTISGSTPLSTANGLLLLTQTAATGNAIYATANSTTNTAITGEATSGTGVKGSGNVGVNGVATNGQGVLGNVTGGTAVWGVASTTGTGLQGNSISGVALAAIVTPSSTNTTVTVAKISRLTSATAANNIAGSLDFNLEADNGTEYLSNQLISKFTTAANATRTSQFIITGVTSAATEDWLTIGQSGYVKFRPMTVTEAGAIATAEGLMVFVSNTDATFTSVGLWIYENAAWHKL